MDYYQILGVSETASQEDIKKAYKKLAMKHHPDRGGDTQQFQSISQAYDILGDVEKRSQYDHERKFGGTQFHFNSDNMQDIFGQMFGGQSPFDQFFRGAHQQRHRPKNRDLNIRCAISIKQAYTGTDLEASYNLPSGRKQTVVIKVPAGIQNGQTIRYPGMGDDTVPQYPRGDLMVTIMVQSTAEYDRRGNDLVYYLVISPFEAMLGCTKTIIALDDSALKLNLQPGVQHGAEFVTKGKGFKNSGGYPGNMIVHVRVEIPAITEQTYRERLLNLYNEISNLSKPNTQ